MTANPNIAVLLVVAGMLGIYLEFCRPGWVVPGVAGGVVGMVGIASLVRWMRAGQSEQISWLWVAALMVPLAMISLWLGKWAVRAKRNKSLERAHSPRTRIHVLKQ